MKAPEENKKDELTDSSPQGLPRGGPSGSSAPAKPLKSIDQEPTAPLPGEGKLPVPPRPPGVPKETRKLPVPNLPEADAPPARAAQPSPAPAPSLPPAPPAAPEPPAPAASLADLDWMPPAEDRVARFLSDVADIAPPPTREREGAAAAGFFLASGISPDDAGRKKARAEPFWSQVAEAPMAKAAAPAAAPTTRAQRLARIRRRARVRRLSVLVVILGLLVIGLIVVVYTHPALLGR